jgi:hypothetical protein
VVMGLKRVLRKSGTHTPDSVRTRTPVPSPRLVPAPSPKPVLRKVESPDSIRSRSPYRGPHKPNPVEVPILDTPEGTPLLPIRLPSAPPSRTPSVASTIDYGPGPLKKSRQEVPGESSGAPSSTDPAPPQAPEPDAEEESEEEDDPEESWAAWKRELDEDDCQTEFRSSLTTCFRAADILGALGSAHDMDAIETMIQTSAYLSGGQQEYVIGIEGSLAQCHAALGSILLPEDTLVLEVSEDGLGQPTIVRDVGVLSKEELQQNKTEVSASKFKEVKGLFDLEDVSLIRKLPGWESYDPVKETIKM